MDDRAITLALLALLLVGAIGLLSALWFYYRPKKKKAPTKPAPQPITSRPAKVIGTVKLTKRERGERSLATLEIAARWAKTAYGPSGKPAPGSYVFLFRQKGEKHTAAITAQVKKWLAEER